jgi:glycosyltransferase involved in cell wall biosynthesis
MADVVVLIPAFNCERTIAEVVRDARAHVGRVLVVDDGSGDRTAEHAAAAGAEVLRLETNRGKGAALLRGLQQLGRDGVERVVTMDGDGQHLGSEIPALLRASDAEPQALVIGARKIEPGSVAPINLFANRFANRWVKIVCGQSLPDTQSGFRVYPVRATLALNCRAGRFAFETEVLIRAVRAGILIRSVWVRAYYPPIRERVSHYRPIADTARIIVVVARLIFRIH